MTRKYISAVTPLKGHVLQVDFVTGSRLLLDMSRYLDKLRFRPLANPEVWNSKRHFHPLRERGAEPRRDLIHGRAVKENVNI